MWLDFEWPNSHFGGFENDKKEQKIREVFFRGILSFWDLESKSPIFCEKETK